VGWGKKAVFWVVSEDFCLIKKAFVDNLANEVSFRFKLTA
jgi:hypothetical protein